MQYHQGLKPEPIMSSLATQIDVDAEITVSELRSEDTFDRRLRDHAALRLRRRNDLLGVIVSTERWKTIGSKTPQR
jgi:hypothetical protein